MFFCPSFRLSCCRMSCNTRVIRVQMSSVDQAQRLPVHLMPCEIEHNGPAQVSQYLTATTKDRKIGTLRTSYSLILNLTQPYLNGVFPHFSHDRENSVIQGTWPEGTRTQLSTGLHWFGTERGQQAWLRPGGKHQ